MEKKSLKLDDINLGFSDLGKTTGGYENKLSFKVASLLSHYDIDEIKENVQKVFNITVTDGEWQELRDSSVSLDEKSNKLALDDYEKNQVLKSFSSRDEIKKIMDSVNMTNKDVVQTIFEEYVNGKDKPLKDQTIDELVATFNISKWLKDTPVSVPSEKDILKNIKLKERLEPFRQLTKNFRGRKDKLDELKDYVDWLPKTGIINNIAGAIRNITNWHNKPPLLIKGIGGVGKSTLIAKFILDHSENKKGAIPFVYLDFDRPGLSLQNPMGLVVEALNQLRLQFPAHEATFNSIIGDIKAKYLSNPNTSQSRQTDRELLYQYYFREQNKVPDVPVLIVFDSFEEIQYRATNTDIRNLFSFLNELSERIPRLRFVFAGRSELASFGWRFTPLPLGPFEKSSAIGYLEFLGFTDNATCQFIFDKVGGHPHSLQLAVDLIKKRERELREEKKDAGATLTLAQIKELFVDIDAKRIQEELVQRNLDHVHDPQVRKIAIPGIVVRRINAEVIKDILAEPCGIMNLSIEQARQIFDNLKKETFLIREEGQNIYFSQELRVAIYNLVTKKHEKQTRQVHDNAVHYYESRKDVESRAEFIYHRLKRGDDPSFLDTYYHKELQPYLENSLVEFPDNAYLYLSRLMNASISEEKRAVSDRLEWEKSMENELVNFFLNGDDYSVEHLEKLLNSRTERLYRSSLLFYEAKFYLRLGKFDVAEAIISKGLNEFNNDLDFERARLQYLKCKLLEYQLDFKNAMFAIEKSAEFFERSPNVAPYTPNANTYIDVIDMALTYIRVVKRQELDVPVDKMLRLVVEMIRPHLREMRLNMVPKPYSRLIQLTKSEEENTLDLLNWSNRIQAADKFTKEYQELADKFERKLDFEKYWSIDVSGGTIFLKDICEPGDLKVLISDALYYEETQEKKMHR